MDISSLSAEDQALLNTDLGDAEKVAAEHIGLVGNLIAAGAEYAVKVAQDLDKLAKDEEESEKAQEEMEDKDSEKKASDYSAFIERGFFEGLIKAGSEKHNCATHYLAPYVSQKLASLGASDEVIKKAMEDMQKKDEEEKDDSKKEASATLSAEDQALLNTDLGEAEKVAAQMIKEAQDMMAMGRDYANMVVAEMDKVAEESKDDEDEDEDEDGNKKEASASLLEDQEKTASDYSAFLERGFSTKLASLGVQNHGDASYYFMPYVANKLAAAGNFMSKAKGFVAKGKDLAKANPGKAAATAGLAGLAAGNASSKK